MTGFYIENFGCRATQADAAAIERQLARHGCRPAAPETAQVLVVHTCTVTASADSQARQAIRALHKKNPQARIFVTGCYAQRAPEELAELAGVEWVVGNAHQMEIPRLIANSECTAPGAGGPIFPLAMLSAASTPLPHVASARPEAKILAGGLSGLDEVLIDPAEFAAVALGGHTRPMLKVQDGCNHRCAYCVIPHVRGRSRSLPPARVVEEILRLIDAGAREVVLSGINLGGYGRDLDRRTTLGDLIGEILDRTPLERLRLSSLEPMHLTAELIERIAASGRVAPHFHIPLQSGSDRILAKMHRWYRAEHYARRIELIRERLPDAGIGADVIAGFPGETDADYRATVDLIERLPFTYLHVFSYSPRPGTEAARLADAVEPEAIRRRARRLRALGAEKAAAFRAKQAGRIARVLTLQTFRDGATDALTGNYLAVAIPGRVPSNQWLTVRLHAPVAGKSRLAADPVNLPS